MSHMTQCHKNLKWVQGFIRCCVSSGRYSPSTLTAQTPFPVTAQTPIPRYDFDRPDRSAGLDNTGSPGHLRSLGLLHRTRLLSELFLLNSECPCVSVPA